MNETDDRDRHPNNPDPNESGTAKIIPVVEEELVADISPVKTGSVRVQKHIEQRVREIDMPLLREDVEVRRVPINKVVEQEPAVRKSGDTIIVPVVEEELVITKRLVLKEELHLIKHRTKERTTREVTLERERAEVQRLDAQGRIVDSTPSDRMRQVRSSKRPSRPPGILDR
jgi:uncharacterized protein (TIGR02271 family)